ncbi:MAG: J domain-containing protein [Defluviitaleaceae bacterium]|nr:J domain-containing protein [Defluviitaleaceae bacterium]
MNNHWKVLGIDPTTDKRAIKKAYAKMLAKYHPEEFPEKFEEINNAYQWALRYFGGNTFDEFLYNEPSHEQNTITEEPQNQEQPIKLELPDGQVIQLNMNSTPGTEEEKIDDWWQEVENPGGDDDIDYDFDYYGYYVQHTESIFKGHTDSTEEPTEAEKLAAKALDEFQFQINTAAGLILQDIKGRRVLKEYVGTEIFKSVRRNPAFIEGLIRVLPGIYFPRSHIIILKKAIGIHGKWDASRYPGEVSIALTRLDNLLQERMMHYFTNGTHLGKSITKAGGWLSLFIVIALAMATMINRSTNTSNPTPGSMEGILGTMVTLPTPPPLTRHIRLTISLTQALFEEHILTSTDVIEEWHDAITNHVIARIYQDTDREAVLINPSFGILEGDMAMPMLLLYMYRDEIGFHPLRLTIYFAEPTNGGQ